MYILFYMLFLILLKMDNILAFSYLKTKSKCGLHLIFNSLLGYCLQKLIFLCSQTHKIYTQYMQMPIPLGYAT